MARVKKESGTTEQTAAASAPVASGDIDLAKVAFPDNGSALANELAKADKETIIDNAKATMFESANAPKEKPIDRRMPGLVERTFAPFDWSKALDRFDAWMALGDHRTEEAHIRKAHEEGPEIMGSVHDVYIQVKFAREAWELENDTMLGAMRAAATEVLEAEKEKKIRTKMITEADINTKVAAMFPDEWAAQEKRRLQYKLVEERAKHCVERGTIRCRHLDTMMNRLR